MKTSLARTNAILPFEAAADPTRFPDAGEAWQVAKLYYHHSFNRERMRWWQGIGVAATALAVALIATGG